MGRDASEADIRAPSLKDDSKEENEMSCGKCGKKTKKKAKKAKKKK
jgi:hypothetical protein